MANTRWSWSGLSADKQTAVIVLWQDVVKRDDSGALVYRDDEDIDADWRRRPGHSERVEVLKHIVTELDGHFRAIIARARDTSVDPREIDSCFPQEGVIWKVDAFDPDTGAFTARGNRG